MTRKWSWQRTSGNQWRVSTLTDGPDVLRLKPGSLVDWDSARKKPIATGDILSVSMPGDEWIRLQAVRSGSLEHALFKEIA